ncbi:MAG: hypothetical protein J1F35_07195 [Erysipelotrichales bacterium]|nr:hypothetical protein [Erysipelotrichales bacterium]
MGDLPNIIDIEHYSKVLSIITGITEDITRTIVVNNISQLYMPSSMPIDLTDVNAGIENDIYKELDKMQEDKEVLMKAM